MVVTNDVRATVGCPHCGARVGRARFCTNCGAPLGGASPAADDGEAVAAVRRQVAVTPEPGEAPARVVACVRCGGVNARSRQTCGRCGADLDAPEPRVGGSVAAGDEPEAGGPPANSAADDTGPHGPARGPALAYDADDLPMPGVIVIVTIILLAVSGAVALTLLSARGIGPFAGPGADAAATPEGAEVAIADVAVSSALEPEGDTTYGAGNLIDDDPSTAWNEAEPGDGTGEWADVALAEPTVVTEVVVWNGYQSGEFFSRHNRVRRLRLVLDDRTFAVRLLDRRGPQAITLPEPVTAQRIRLEVDATFPGTVYNDTALSEVAVHGVPRDP